MERPRTLDNTDCKRAKLNVKILSVRNPTTKTTVMIVLIAIRILWNALALLTIRNANVLSLT